jgi:hypothetical protein
MDNEATSQEIEIFEGTSPVGSLDIQFQGTNLLLKADFMDHNGNMAIDAEETATISVNVKNEGPGKAYNLVVSGVMKERNSHVTGNLYKNVGTLNANETASLKMHLNSDEFLEDGTLVIHFEANDQYDRSARPLEMSIETRTLVPPQLVVDFGIDDDMDGNSYGNSNSKIEKGETIEVKVIIQNQGQGLAENVVVDLSPVEGLFFVGRESIRLGDLNPGEYHDIDFTFAVPTQYDGGDNLPFELIINEARNRYGSKEMLNFALNRTEKTTNTLEPETMTISGIPQGRVDIVEAPSLVINVDVNIPTSNSINEDAYAVIIGNADYQYDDVPNVDFAVRDAAIMKEYLINILGYRESNILYYTNATSAIFRSIFGTREVPDGRLARYIKKDESDVFIYYSGHGAPDINDKRAFFVPVDCHPGDVRINGYELDLFYENLSKIKARSITIAIDACFSGGSQAGMLINNASPIGIATSNPVLNNDAVTIFVSSTGDQISSWYPEKKHGLFTYFFLKGLRGAADENLDKQITASELFSFVSDQSEGVPDIARRLYQGRHQKPQLFGNSDRIIAEVNN